jgi:hypothetical protein
MFTRRILALAATLFTIFTMTGTTAGAATVAGSRYHYTVSTAGPSHRVTGPIPDSHCFVCR